jgi:hypothetical protein
LVPNLKGLTNGMGRSGGEGSWEGLVAAQEPGKLSRKRCTGQWMAQAARALVPQTLLLLFGAAPGLR